MAKREILFRGWNKKNKKWLYGYYCVNRGEHFIAPGAFVNNLEPYDDYVIDANTVGQYTGLTDAKGKRIFEGDVLDFTVFDCFDNDKQFKGVVKYDGSRFMLWHSWESEFYGADGGFELDWVADQDCELTVIGNIYDNPNLLKGE